MYPLPDRPTILPPAGLGIDASPAVIVELVTPPTYPDPPPGDIPMPAPPPPK